MTSLGDMVSGRWYEISVVVVVVVGWILGIPDAVGIPHPHGEAGEEELRLTRGTSVAGRQTQGQDRRGETAGGRNSFSTSRKGK